MIVKIDLLQMIYEMVDYCFIVDIAVLNNQARLF